MKKMFCIAGGGLAIGTAAVIVMKKLRTREYNEVNLDSEYDAANEGDSAVRENTLTEKNVAQDRSTPYEDEKNVKNCVAESMYSRHQEAALIMGDSIRTIDENVKNLEDTDDKIDAVSDELKKMLEDN